jgi:hypothetical protein
MDFALSCDELSKAWADYVRSQDLTSELEACANDIKLTYTVDDESLPDSCPYGFSPELLDEYFGDDGNERIQYTSSIFASISDTGRLYDAVDDYDRAHDSNVVEGVYDTQYEAFMEAIIDDSIVNDMALALGSAVITLIAIVVHTRSVWVAVVGLAQIVLSFPLAYFVYAIVARLTFFPFLNFIGVFVIFALGADDIFVAVDKWKNARLGRRNATTERIAAIALPDAAGAMFLTTVRVVRSI